MKAQFVTLICIVFVSFLSVGYLSYENMILQNKLQQKDRQLKEVNWFKERVKYYMLINSKQEDIINKFKKTKEMSRRDSTLQELKLYVN